MKENVSVMFFFWTQCTYAIQLLRAAIRRIILHLDLIRFHFTSVADPQRLDALVKRGDIRNGLCSATDTPTLSDLIQSGDHKDGFYPARTVLTYYKLFALTKA